MKPSTLHRSDEGFGFVEVIIVISVIGIMTSIAIPAVSRVFARSETTRDSRNAQSLVSTFNAARAAGNNNSYSDAESAIGAVTTLPGINGRGIYATCAFYVSMSGSEITEASAKIEPALSGSTTEGFLTIKRR